MQRVRTMVPRDREPFQTYTAVADRGTPTPPPPLGWCPRLAQGWVRPGVGRGQPRSRPRADDWEVPHAHVQPQTSDSPPGPAGLGRGLYHTYGAVSPEALGLC